MNYYVSKTGDDLNTGDALGTAFKTINKGIGMLKPGDTLLIGAGTYIEAVEIIGLNHDGKKKAPVVTTIKALGNEEVRIENTLLHFRKKGSTGPTLDVWKPSTDAGAPHDEYVSPVLDVPDVINFSTGKFNNGIKGAFLDFDHKPNTRLINYSNINDLRSGNQKFGKIVTPVGDTHNIVQVLNGDGSLKTNSDYPGGFYYPFVYMGPGFWIERGIDGDPDKARIHIRLAHTHNDIDGLADYTGEKNPNKISLAFTVKKNQPTLLVRNSRYIKLQNLTISFGGEHTVKLNNTKGITFEKMHINASEYGILGSGNEGIVLRNCIINGGLPTWYFRNDRKDGYYYKSGDDLIENVLAKETISSLIKGSPADKGTKIFNCNFINGHDLYLAGEVEFYSNYMHNLNDDGILFLENEGNSAKVYKNVFTKCLSCFSFALNDAPTGGPWYIYRNLIDLREPTESHRPVYSGATLTDDERYGWFYKNNGITGSQYFFHNTAIVINGKKPAASFTQLAAPGNHTYGRINANNIFVAVSINPEIKKTVMKFSSPVYPDMSDGNLYYRIGIVDQNIFEYPEYIFEGATKPAQSFDHFDGNYKRSDFFRASQVHYAPGYENSGNQASPQFRSMSDDGLPLLSDDFRLGTHSPAKEAGVVLPDELTIMATGHPSPVKPDIGCFRFNSAPLKVGFGSRLSFPKL